VATIEHRVVTKSGDVRWQFWTDRGIFDSKGTLVEVQCVGRDVTRRKRAEMALRESGERLRRLSTELLLAQEKERKRIANELHDGISQSLTAIKFMAEKGLAGEGFEGSPPGEANLVFMVEKIQQTIEEVRRIMTDLRPSILDDIGIVATIGWFCREFRNVYSSIRVEERLSVEEEDIPDALKIVLFRMLQEAMNNVVKHSKADFVIVSLEKNANRIELAIRDNGVGFDVKSTFSPKSGSTGLGLRSMKERAELSGGSLSIKSRKGRGTLIKGVWHCPTEELPEASE
jgi:signal transduction histidine kinase